MKNIEKLKLAQLSKAELSKRELNKLVGGETAVSVDVPQRDILQAILVVL